MNAAESILSIFAPGFLREERDNRRQRSAQEQRIAALKARAVAKPHGTRARYSAGCKCMFCRAANSRYKVARALERKNGNANPIVSAERARDRFP